LQLTSSKITLGIIRASDHWISSLHHILPMATHFIKFYLRGCRGFIKVMMLLMMMPNDDQNHDDYQNHDDDQNTVYEVVQQCGAWSKFHIPQKSFFCFFMFFCPDQLTIFMWILSDEAGFCKLTFHPPISGITAHATMPGRLEHSIISFCFTLYIQMYDAWNIVSWVGGLNPWPYSHELSALTTRLRLP